MKKAFLLLLIVFLSLSFRKTSVAISNARALMEKTDELSDLETTNFSSLDKIEFERDSCEMFEKAVLNCVFKETKAYGKKLKGSKILHQLSKIGLTKYRSLESIKQTKRKSTDKFLRAVFQASNANFSIIHSFVFRIPVVKEPRHFFYDKGKSGLALFKGKKPSSTEMKDPNYIEPDALDRYSAKEMENVILKQFRVCKLNHFLKNRDAKYIGISIAPEQSTFGKKKIPYLKVMVIVGEKMLAKVKIKNT